MNKKAILSIILYSVLVLVLVLTGCSAQTGGPTTTVTVTTTAPASGTTTSTPATSGKSYTFTFAWNDVWGPDTQAGQILRPGGVYQRMLYERSNGQVQLKMVSKMYPGADILSAVGRGAADMGNMPTPYYSGTYPLWNWEDVPGMVTLDQPDNTLQEVAIYQDPRFLAIYDKTFRAAGAVFQWAIPWGNCAATYTTKPISTLADLKGLKIRANSAFSNEALTLLGASPVTIPSPDITLAMKTGVIEGAQVTSLWGYQIGLTDVAKNIVYLPISPGWTESVIMNPAKFDALPKDLQKVMIDVGQEMTRQVSLAMIAEFIAGDSTVKGFGVKITSLQGADLTKALDLVKPVRDSYVKASGSDGAELIKIIDDVTAKYKAFNANPK